MPSMTPMMSAIWLELSLMAPIVLTTWATTAPPCTATAEAVAASWFASPALLAFCRTVAVSVSIELAVSSRELACASVRADRSALPSAISCVATDISPVLLRMSPISPVRLALMVFIACSSTPISSARSMTASMLRSPPAINCAVAIAWSRLRLMWRYTSFAAIHRPADRIGSAFQ